jgi:plastocyanin
MRTFADRRFLRPSGYLCLLTLCLSAGATPSAALQAPVTGEVEVVKRGAGNQAASNADSANASNVVVWLIPLDHSVQTSAPTTRPTQIPELVQRNKTFQPHTLVVEVGTVVQFPNKDPFFHNIFSLFEGKRFDLGLYEAGSSRTVRFDRPGVSFLFCNIHAEMSGVVVAVETPYFGSSDRSGHLAIANVPDGRYEMHVWYERSLPEDSKSLTRVLIISDSARSLSPIRVVENPSFSPAHKNKYGQDYVPPLPGYMTP